MTNAVADSFRSIMKPFEDLAGAATSAKETINGYIEQGKKWCDTLDRTVEQLTKDHLPKKYQKIVMQIIRAVPEILMCFAAFSGVGVFPAALFWAARVVYASMPIIKNILDGQFSIKALWVAGQETLSNLVEARKKFYPAIAICAVVQVVASSVFAFTTLNAIYTLRAVLYTAIAEATFAVLQREGEVEGAVAASSDPIASTTTDTTDTTAAAAGSPAQTE